MRPWKLLDRGARKGGVTLVLAVLFLPFGVPRWLIHDTPAVPSQGGGKFERLCRDRGGTPATGPGAGTNAPVRRYCAIRYGARVYVMDAITSDGFDADTARYQRQGCAEARREQRALAAAGGRWQVFVYHARTGVCERRSIGG